MAGMRRKKLDITVRFFSPRNRKLVHIRSTNDLPDDLDGQYDPESETVKLRPSLRGKKLFEILSHELGHRAHPHIDEDWIEKYHESFANLIFRDDILDRLGLQKKPPRET